MSYQLVPLVDESLLEQWKLDEAKRLKVEFMVSKGLSQMAATYQAQLTIRALFKEGLPSHQQKVYWIQKGDERMGYIWIGPNGSEEFYIYDVVVNSDHRGKGVARYAIEAVKKILQEMGIFRLGAHVFANNLASLSLLQSSGFNVISHNLCTQMDPVPNPPKPRSLSSSQS